MIIQFHLETCSFFHLFVQPKFHGMTFRDLNIVQVVLFAMTSRFNPYGLHIKSHGITVKLHGIPMKSLWEIPHIGWLKAMNFPYFTTDAAWPRLWCNSWRWIRPLRSQKTLHENGWKMDGNAIRDWDIWNYIDYLDICSWIIIYYIYIRDYHRLGYM